MSFIIPNYNGAGILPRCFPPTHAVAAGEFADARIIVVDDASTDDGPRWLAQHFPDVTLIRAEENRGFGETVNRGVTASDADLVVLLNSDVQLAPGSLAPVLPYFEDPRTFAVTMTSLTEEGAFREGANRIILKGGLPHTCFNRKDQVHDEDGRGLSSYPVGGHAVVRRSYFLELGGFDPLFEPFYWEDADLGLRAERRGWRTYHEPRAKVIHLKRGSIRTHRTAADVALIKTRNRFLVLWRNFPPRDRGILQHLLLGGRFIQAALTADTGFFRAFRMARRRWREAPR